MRAGGDPRLLVDALRDQVKQLDPLLAVADVRLMDQVADESIATPRFSFFLVGLFAGLAIVLAAIGTYGVISYSVSQRIPEFGLRLALGAPPRGVLLMVLLQAVRLAVGGAVIGLAVALVLARVMRSMMYNVSPADPFTFVSVVTWSLPLHCSPAICRHGARRRRTPWWRCGRIDSNCWHNPGGYELNTVSRFAKKLSMLLAREVRQRTGRRDGLPPRAGGAGIDRRRNDAGSRAFRGDAAVWQ